MEKIPSNEEIAAQTAQQTPATENPAESALPDDLTNSLSHDDQLSEVSAMFPDDTPENSPASPSADVDTLPSKDSRPIPSSVPVHRWFVTFMCMNIPVIGWIYLIALAFSRSKGPRRDFAKAYLLYKLVFLLLSLAILAVALHYGLELLDKVLTYMEML